LTLIYFYPGIPIRTTLDNTATVIYTGAMAAIEERATSLIRDMDPTNELLSLRVQTRKFEVMLKTSKWIHYAFLPYAII
jgi:hypothetical protein